MKRQSIQINWTAQKTFFCLKDCQIWKRRIATTIPFQKVLLIVTLSEVFKILHMHKWWAALYHFPCCIFLIVKYIKVSSGCEKQKGFTNLVNVSFKNGVSTSVSRFEYQLLLTGAESGPAASIQMLPLLPFSPGAWHTQKGWGLITQWLAHLDFFFNAKCCRCILSLEKPRKMCFAACFLAFSVIWTWFLSIAICLDCSRWLFKYFWRICV